MSSDARKRVDEGAKKPIIIHRNASLDELVSYLRRLSRDRFYGEVVVRFRKGDPVLIERRETIPMGALKIERDL